MRKFIILIFCAALGAIVATVLAKSLDVENASAIGGGVGGAIGAVFAVSQSNKRKK